MSHPNAARLAHSFLLSSHRLSICTRVGEASESDGAPSTLLHTPSGVFCSSAFQEPLNSLSQHNAALGFLRLPVANLPLLRRENSR